MTYVVTITLIADRFIFAGIAANRVVTARIDTGLPARLFVAVLISCVSCNVIDERIATNRFVAATCGSNATDACLSSRRQET